MVFMTWGSGWQLFSLVLAAVYNWPFLSGVLLRVFRPLIPANFAG